MICCDTDNWLGCLCTCDDISTNFVADQTGDYTISVIYHGSTWDKTIPLTAGEEIIIPATPAEPFFREHGVTRFMVKAPDDNYLQDNENNNICFKFKARARLK